MKNVTCEEEYAKAQQELIDKFKSKMKDACEDILGTIYVDCAQWAVTDAHTNYHNYLKEYFRESLLKEITEEYSHYSWAHSIRKTLLEKYPEKISNKIIEDLNDRVKSLEEHIEQLRNRF